MEVCTSEEKEKKSRLFAPGLLHPFKYNIMSEEHGGNF